MSLIRVVTVLCGMFYLAVAGSAHAIPVQVDLTQFSVDGSTISVASNGSTAQLEEDSAKFAVLLFNDPSLGDPNLIIPGANTFLLFDYVFDEAINNEDFFQVFLYEAGNYTGLPTFEADMSGSGTLEFDLSAYTGMTLGLDFVLVSNDFDVGSSVTVSNLRLDSRPQPPKPVPEPTAFFLFALGLGLLGWQRQNNKLGQRLRGITG